MFKLKKSLTKAGIGAILLFISFIALSLFSEQSAAPAVPIINENTISINDSNAYLSATPHTITDSGYVIFNLSTKSYSGNIDIFYGYNSNNSMPISAELFNPHYYNKTKSFSCNLPNWYNYTNNLFWCWENYSIPLKNGANKTIGWNNGSNLIFDHDFTYANISINTAYWNELQYAEYSDISGAFNKVNYEYGGMDTWYYKTNIPITANNMYQMRVWQDVKMNTNGKYWFAAKPSSESIDTAIANGHFYSLDPWWNTSWSYVRPIVITNASALVDYQVNVLINSSYITNINWSNKGNDIRFTYDNGTSNLTLPHWIEYWNNLSVSNASVWVKTNYSTVYMWYGNPSAVNTSNIFATLVNGSDDFENGTFGNFTNSVNLSAVTTYVKTGDFSMRVDGVVAYVSNVRQIPSGNYSISYWFYDDGSTAGTGRVLEIFWGNSTNAYTFGIGHDQNEAANNYSFYNGSQHVIWGRATGWHNVLINTTSSGWLGYLDGLYVGRSSVVTPITQFRVDSRTMDGWYDDLAILKYMAVAPTYTIGAEQTNGGGGDTTVPTFSLNSTNGTVAGTQIKHSLLAADETALSGYIFSFDNGTGAFINDTWAAFGATGWVNVSKGANATVGSTIRWFVWANDTSNNKNQSQIYSYLVTAVTDTLPPSLIFSSPTNTTYTTGNIWFNITADETLNSAWFSLDGAANVSLTNSSGNWNYRNSSVKGGTHNVMFFANDTSGNLNATSEKIYFSVNYTLSGTVKDKYLNIVSGAIVYVIYQPSNLTVATKVTNSTGGWTYNTNIAGNYTIAAENRNNISQGGGINPHIAVR